MAADQNAREKLVRFLDEQAFDPILHANPERYAEGEREKLEHVKGATERTQQGYHQHLAGFGVGVGQREGARATLKAPGSLP